MRDLLFVARFRVDQLHTFGHLARNHPEIGHLAQVGFDSGFEDEQCRRSVAVGLDFAAVHRNEIGRFERSGSYVDDEFHQPLRTDIAFARRAEYRNQVAFGKAQFQAGAKFVLCQHSFFKIELHQRFVILIVAKCIRKKKYKVIFYARGGKYNKTVKARYGCKFNYPKDPVKKGYVFMGWYADKKCTTRFASTEINKKGTVNVYAKWMKLEEYEQLNEQYSKAKAVVDPAVASADAQYFSSLQKDPEIEKIEAEKLSYMAKKAEEDRKTEEVKLQSIKEIEASKNSEEARAKAEKEADEARNALDSALKERDAIIAKARAEERSKCYGEVADSLKNDNENLANALNGTAIVPAGAAANAQQPMNLEEQLRKIKEEAKAEAKKEIEEEMKRKAEEEARINALVEARVKEIIDRKDKEAEIARFGSETKAATDPAILERLALAEEKIARYEEMLAKNNVTEDNAEASEELPAEVAPVEEETEVEAKEDTAPAEAVAPETEEPAEEPAEEDTAADVKETVVPATEVVTEPQAEVEEPTTAKEEPAAPAEEKIEEKPLSNLERVEKEYEAYIAESNDTLRKYYKRIKALREAAEEDDLDVAERTTREAEYERALERKRSYVYESGLIIKGYKSRLASIKELDEE